MSGATVNCVSVANGALSPDLRMNYSYGLVLGVDEFRQEQLYILSKDYLENRALHGYGTVYGLKVTADRPADNPDEVVVTVEPGMGVDQYGQSFLVRDPQCARLGAWLASQEQQQPGAIAAHLGASNDLHVYVVANYDSCQDALVPVPSQPCASADSSQVPSRIRDAFDIELRWDPPAMPAWEAVRRFARLMAHVRLVPGLPPAQSDEPEIIALVRGLDQPGPFDFPGDIEVLSSPPQPFEMLYHLPLEGSREALDRIFTVWVTEVRPRLQPDLSDPSGTAAGSGSGTSTSSSTVDKPNPAAILLARLDFVPDLPFDTQHPGILEMLDPVDEGRPILLHTGLIQELTLLESLEDSDVPDKDVREFVTFDTVPGDGGSNWLRAWFHVAGDVGLPDTISALRVNADNQIDQLTFQTRNELGTPFGPVWDLTPVVSAVQTPFQSEDMLNFAFDTTRIRVGPTGQSLAAIIPTLPYTFLGSAGGNIIQAFYAVPPIPQPQRLPPPGLTWNDIARLPTLPFVTITPEAVASNQLPLELWLHLDLNSSEFIMGIAADFPTVNVLGELPPAAGAGNLPRLVPLPLSGWARLGPVVFRAELDLNRWKAAGSPSYLRFIFPTKDNRVVNLQTNAAMTLDQFIRTPNGPVNVKFDGSDDAGNIVAYVRMPQVGAVG